MGKYIIRDLGKWPLDNITNDIFDFSNKIIDSDMAFTTKEAYRIKAFLKKNLVYFITR